MWTVPVLLTATLGAQVDLRLIDALARRDRDTALALIEQRRGIDAARPDGATALHWAVYWDDAEISGRLLAAGAGANVANELGVTPLDLASANGNGPLVAKLLAAGSDPNRPTGVPPLLRAARVGSVAAVNALLAHGARIDATESSQGQTALMWAVSQRHAEVARVLVAGGANLTIRSKVSMLRMNRGGAIASSERPVPADVARGGSTALLLAARAGDVASVEALVAAGADVNDAMADGTSALVLAAHSGHGTLAELLLEKGSDPDAAAAGYTALHAAVLMGDRSLTAALLAHGADPNPQIAMGNPTRRTGEDLVLPNSLVGATPYLLAARFGEVEMMRMLVDAGADVTLRLADGTTPIMAAAGVGWALPNNRRGVDMTNKKSAWLGQEAEEAITLESVRAALRFDPQGDLNASNSTGETALFGAVPKGFGGVIELLAASGASLDARNRRGQTLLSLTRVRLVATAATPPEVLVNTSALLRRLGAPE